MELIMREVTSIRGEVLRALLSTAADETLRETDKWLAERWIAGEGASLDSTAHQDALAWLAARLTQEGWNLVPAAEPDQLAAVMYAIHELIEWVSHRRRAETAGQAECWFPLTWAPREETTAGRFRWVVSAVEQRLELLGYELADAGIAVVTESERGAA
jgi:hypothetical protein